MVITPDGEFHSNRAPALHPAWVPAGKIGHFCISDRFCPCGHWSGGRRATTRVDGKRGQVNIDTQEGNTSADNR